MLLKILWSQELHFDCSVLFESERAEKSLLKSHSFLIIFMHLLSLGETFKEGYGVWWRT